LCRTASTSFGGQRAVTKLVASRALDRHPKLKVLVSEGGATWVPFIADRMEEGYRQHAMVVRPKLSRSPREIIYSQVYASFQHDSSAIAAMTAMSYRNVLWGSDYPNIEGYLRPYPRDVAPAVRRRRPENQGPHHVRRFQRVVSRCAAAAGRGQVNVHEVL
jgi:hypothetical protein